jgi:hypothetical protein
VQRDFGVGRITELTCEAPPAQSSQDLPRYFAKENAISAPITKLRELRSVQTSDVQFLFTEKSMNGGSKREAGKKINLAGKRQWNCKLLP